MTSAPAARLGLKRSRRCCATARSRTSSSSTRQTVRSNATYDEPRQFPDGIEHVIVNGVPVVENGVHTGATPGRALRHGRD